MTAESRGRAEAVEAAEDAPEAVALPPVARHQRTLPKLADPDAPLLVVEDLKTYFTLESGTVKAVDGVSFRLEQGEALGIAGESGCGKTTTALSLVRVLPSNANIVGGSIKLMGIDLVPKSENALRRYRWREVSIVFQGAMNALNPVQRVATRSPSRSRSGSAPRSRTRASGRASCSSSSASRARAGPPIRTSSRAGCVSGR